jgi:PAS domain S-box-containing protein
MLIIFVVDYESTVESKWQALIKQQVSAVESGRQAIEADIEQVFGDVRILASNFQVFDYIDFDSIEALKAQFLFFSQNKPRYDQIRYLNNDGMEVIRVERNNKGYAVLEARKHLQDKSSRYYFKQAQLLARNEIYLSSIDWNMENGQIEMPLKPTIRFVMPVFDKYSRQQGVVVINYLASHLITRFIEASTLKRQQLFLVNNEGELLYLPDNNNGSKWILGEAKRIKEFYPDLWQQIETNLQGQLVVDKGYYTFTSIKPIALTHIKARKDWILISQLLPSELLITRHQFIEDRLSLYLVMSLVIFVLLVIYTRIKITHQQALKVSQYEQRFRQILEGLNQSAVIIHPSGQLIYANQYFLTQLGFESEQIQLQDWRSFFMEKTLDNEQKQVASLIKHPANEQAIEFQIYNQQRRLRAYKWSVSFFTDNIEKKQHLTLIGDDITEQQELEIERNKLSQAVEQASVTVMITDLQGYITYVNPNFSEVSGYSISEVLGKTPSFLKSKQIEKAESQPDYQSLWQTIEQGNTWHGQFCNRAKNGEEYWESAAISPVKNKKGETIAYIAVKRDITQERRLSNKLSEEKNAKLKHEHDAVVGRMAYMIAHDLRNPLSSVKMTMQMLPQMVEQQSDAVGELTDISLEQIFYMEDILTSLLAYARPDKNKYQWLAITKIIHAVMQSEAKVEKYQSVDVCWSFEENLPLIEADATKMQQVFQNLIVNAIQAAMSEKTEKPSINITVKTVLMESGEKLYISIENNGETLGPFMEKKIFEPFYTTKAKGTGLGLAIVKNIIDYHHGSISLKAIKNGGTRCLVLLPLSSAVQGVNQSEQQKQKSIELSTIC